MHTINNPMQSTFQITAIEVHRLAVASLADMDAKRQKLVKLVLERLSEEKCSHFLGLWTHNRYDSAEEAMEHAPEIQRAQNWAQGDYSTCEQLKAVAQYLMDKGDDFALITLTINDYRALA